MNPIHNKIDHLISLGLNFDIDKGKDWLIANLEEYHDLDDENYPLWLIVREMGNTSIVDKDLNEFSSNVSTFLFEDFFFYNKLSSIFSELNRISNEAITYKVIKEFGPLYNTKHSRSTETIWDKHNESLPGNAEKMPEVTCIYEICGHEYKFDYNFFKGEPTVLNSEFIDQLSSKLEDLFIKANINFYSEDFITFFSTSQYNQELLAEEPTFLLNKQLIKKYRKPVKEEQTETREKLDNQVDRYSGSDPLKRLATKNELHRLENHRKDKVKEFILVSMLCLVFSIALIWLMNTQLFEMPFFYFSSCVLLGLIVFYIIFVFSKMKLKSIKKDLAEKKVKKIEGIISDIFQYSGKTIVDLDEDCEVRKIIIDRYVSNLKIGNEIVFEVFDASNVFLRISSVNQVYSN